MNMQNITAAEFDQKFLSAFKLLCASIHKNMEDSVMQVFRCSNSFLSETAQKALEDFYSLYSDNENMAKQRDAVNRSVDELFEQAKSQLAQVQDVANAQIILTEDAELNSKRLGMSAIQKQLETLITLDAGIRERLLPALMSMQFEDAVSQTLKRVVAIWEKLIDHVGIIENPDLTDADRATMCADLKEFIRHKVVASTEIKAFYRSVLKESPPPDNVLVKESWLSSLI